MVYVAPGQSAMPVAKVGPAVVSVCPKVQLVVTTGVPAVMLDTQSTSALLGQVIVGGSFAIVSVWVQLAALMQASVAV